MQIKGHLNRINEDGKISGWVVSSRDSEPLTVHLLIDKKLVAKQKASILRPDIARHGLHATGQCGFHFPIPEEYSKRESFEVSVRAQWEGRSIDLTGSPQIMVRPFRPLKESDLASFQRGKGEKILVVGLPKSGTSILTYAIARQFPGMEILFEPQGERSLQDLKFHYATCRKPGPVLAKCHLYPVRHLRVGQIGKFYDKKVWIHRDPRDWMISVFFYVWYHQRAKRDLYPRTLALVKQKENNPGSIHFTDLLTIVNDLDWYTSHYRQVVDSISGLSPAEWHILPYHRFIDDRLEALSSYIGREISKEASLPRSLKRVARSKRYGNWRQWFTEKDVVVLRPMLSGILGDLGYDPNDWRLEPVENLPSETGSKYMERLFSESS